MVSLTFHSPSHSGGAPLNRRSMLDRLASACGAARREWQVRRTVRAIEAMDPYMLVDLGISPGGIEDAVRNGR